MEVKKSLSQYSDEEVLALYEKHGSNAQAASREVGCGPSTFKSRIALLKDPTYVSEKEKGTAVAFLMEELEARGIDPRIINIKHARVKTNKKRWESFHKDEGTQAAVVTPLKSDQRYVEIEFSPKFEDGPEWPVIQQPAPVKVLYAAKSAVVDSIFAKRVFIIPDIQIGYSRDLVSGALRPFHDERGIEVMLQMLQDYKPDTVVILGDFIDVASLSRWLQVAEFQLTLQPSIDYAYALLAKIRSIVGPTAVIEYIEGNHERRLSEFITKNALAAFGIRKGGAPESWPVMSVPHILRLDELNIGYSVAYPGGEYWITPKLVAMHQPPAKKTDLRASVIHGHTPHIRSDGHTVHYHEGIETYYTYSVPGLMRIDEQLDKMSLVRTSVPSNTMRVNWQQGVATVEVLNDDIFKVEVHPISNGMTIFRDKFYDV